MSTVTGVTGNLEETRTSRVRVAGLVVTDMSEEQFSPEGSPMIPDWSGHTHILSLARALAPERVFDCRLWLKPGDDSNTLHKLYPEVGKAGTEGVKLCSQLAELGPISQFVEKVQYSSFFRSKLHSLLQAQGVNILLITGINTDCCVFATALDAFYLGYELWLIEDACLSVMGESGHRHGIEEFKRYFGHRGRVLQTKDALEELEKMMKE